MNELLCYQLWLHKGFQKGGKFSTGGRSFRHSGCQGGCGGGWL